MTMGIPRALTQAGDQSLAAALRSSLAEGLGAAGWRVVPPGSEGWTLRLTLDRLWCDGYFNEFSYAVGIRLHLLDSAGNLRARAERHQDLVLPYKHSADMAAQASETLRLALRGMLNELELGVLLQAGRPLVPTPQAAAPTPPTPPSSACSSCGAPTQAAWRHCPGCGSSLR